MWSYNLLHFLLVLVTVSEKLLNSQAFRDISLNGEQRILALVNETINIRCKKDIPMAYCGFTHPTGKRYSFSGRDLAAGQCTLKVTATAEDSGDWTCHIGKKETGVEITQNIHMRVVGPLASVEPNITATHGKEVTLACVTTKGMTPLRYCRFEPPNGDPFNVDLGITPKNLIANKYYFPQNKSLDRGDCAVTIRKVKYDDVGVWTCGAGLDDDNEYIDTITVQVEGLYNMSTASATSITLSAIALAAFIGFLGFVIWKKRHALGIRRREPEVIDIQEMGPLRSGYSPRLGRIAPAIVIQSPSESSASPPSP